MLKLLKVICKNHLFYSNEQGKQHPPSSKQPLFIWKRRWNFIPLPTYMSIVQVILGEHAEMNGMIFWEFNLSKMLRVKEISPCERPKVVENNVDGNSYEMCPSKALYELQQSSCISALQLITNMKLSFLLLTLGCKQVYRIYSTAHLEHTFSKQMVHIIREMLTLTYVLTQNFIHWNL